MGLKMHTIELGQEEMVKLFPMTHLRTNAIAVPRKGGYLAWGSCVVDGWLPMSTILIRTQAEFLATFGVPSSEVPVFCNNDGDMIRII